MTAPADPPGSGFGPSDFVPASLGATPGIGEAERAGPAPTLFDVCHVGVVLRTVLFVETVVLLGVAFVAEGRPAGALLLTLASAVGLLGTATWLVVACALRHALARRSPARQRLLAGALGAGSAGLAWTVVHYGAAGVSGLGPWFATVAAGAFLGVLLTVWLQLRQRGSLPAETTARLAELQSRIRPHFLFNTLNSALGLVRRDPARAEALLEDLSELFRVALADGATAVSLGDEIELARRYLAIEQTRFGERLQVVWELDPAAATARLPPLLLQPLVENAVRHGVEPEPDGGVIRVRTRARRGQAWVSIANTLPRHPSPAAAGHGIALANVRERLRLMHDVAAQFEAQVQGDAYRVQIVLPLG
jgi:two-component system sensor histidine kinase AlgZ